jgi:hypothetical protein
MRDFNNSKFKDIHVGDKVKFNNKTDNVAIKAGEFIAEIVKEDNHSFAINPLGYNFWWFYRDTGRSYVGNAIVVEKINNK